MIEGRERTGDFGPWRVPYNISARGTFCSRKKSLFGVVVKAVVSFGIDGAQMEASSMHYLGTCGTPRIYKGEGVKFLLA